jgi:hypothetical protein
MPVDRATPHRGRPCRANMPQDEWSLRRRAVVEYFLQRDQISLALCGDGRLARREFWDARKVPPGRGRRCAC